MLRKTVCTLALDRQGAVSLKSGDPLRKEETMRSEIHGSNRRKGILANSALVFVILVYGLQLEAQPSPAVHGTGAANTIPLWTDSATLGNSVVTQSGNNVGLPGTLSATGLNCPACVGNPQLSINYAGSSTQGGDANNALKLGGLTPGAFAQLAAASNSFAGNISVGGLLSAYTVNSGNGGFQFAGTPVLTILPGSFNLFVGQAAGAGAGSNNTGSNNTATGFHALFSNTTGSYNTANGGVALYNNTTGGSNTATGLSALTSNTTGSSNTAMGTVALFSSTTGNNNTAMGNASLFSNTTGVNNTAVGNNSLLQHSTGDGNTAVGDGAMYSQATGTYNTSIGRLSLSSVAAGSYNTAVGNNAGLNLTGSDSYNIDVNNGGVPGDFGIIRIGTAGTQKAAYIAGITGVMTGSATASTVIVDTNGQLGTIASSRRYKEDIRDMGADSDGLLSLRPVTFHYRKPYSDGSKPIQYGLIAEEVAEVYPDLVVRGKDGQPETVQYYKLDAMLLNEVQKLCKLHSADQAEIAELQSEIEGQRKQWQDQQAAMKRLEAQFRLIQAALAHDQSASGSKTLSSALSAR